MKYAVRLTRLAMSSMLNVLNQETITVKSVRDLLWGYEDSLFKLAKDVMPPENVVPHDKFGLFVGVSEWKWTTIIIVTKKNESLLLLPAIRIDSITFHEMFLSDFLRTYFHFLDIPTSTYWFL